jgi:outer membrane lipoprotein SlyB
MKRTTLMKVIGLPMLAAVVGCSGPLTTREKGAAIGTVGGAAVGGIIGAAVDHPAAGAAIGGAAGLGTGALIGDRVQALENKQADLDKQIEANQQELERQRKEIEQLKKERGEY